MKKELKRFIYVAFLIGCAISSANAQAVNDTITKLTGERIAVKIIAT